jgi:hypothetical protein
LEAYGFYAVEHLYQCVDLRGVEGAHVVGAAQQAQDDEVVEHVD